jgi:non-ribosomal peptide synthetase component F
VGASVDYVAVYGALATVAAVTAALQAAAVFALYPEAGLLEERNDAAAPGTMAETDVRRDAKHYRTRVVILNSPMALINALVLLAWGDVVFCRIPSDWIYIVPWVGVLLAWASLVAIPAWLFARARLQ